MPTRRPGDADVAEDAGLISYEEYHPYGSTAFHAAASGEVSAKRYRYTGMEKDEETGLSYHHHRHYAVWLGRWCSGDPIGLAGGINRWAYCSGNPVSRTDASGLDGTEIEMDVALVNGGMTGQEIAAAEAELAAESGVLAASLEVRQGPQVRLVVEADDPLLALPGELWVTSDGGATFWNGVGEPPPDETPAEDGSYAKGVANAPAELLLQYLDVLSPELRTSDLAAYIADTFKFSFSNEKSRLMGDAGEAFGITMILLPLDAASFEVEAIDVVAEAIEASAKANRAGAGGGWKVIGEARGGAVGQSTPLSCGAACGEMLSGIPEADLIRAAGAPTDATTLARAIRGHGGYVGPDQLGAVLNNGPFAAHLYEGGKMGHFVVVDGLDQAGRLMIRDPWAGGSTYSMDLAEFLRVWNGEAIFK